MRRSGVIIKSMPISVQSVHWTKIQLHHTDRFADILCTTNSPIPIQLNHRKCLDYLNNPCLIIEDCRAKQFKLFIIGFQMWFHRSLVSSAQRSVWHRHLSDCGAYAIYTCNGERRLTFNNAIHHALPAHSLNGATTMYLL